MLHIVIALSQKRKCLKEQKQTFLASAPNIKYLRHGTVSCK